MQVAPYCQMFNYLDNLSYGINTWVCCAVAISHETGCSSGEQLKSPVMIETQLRDILSF